MKTYTTRSTPHMGITRRHVLVAAAASRWAAGSDDLAAEDSKGKSPNDRIQIACIGFGTMGSADVATSTSLPGVALVGICDVYEGRLTRAKEIYGERVFTTRDYREVLARRDVDAVIIATPDHWHSEMATEAMKAGKDVYLQKPIVQKLEDGHKVISTARDTGRILQVGSQGVSSIIYRKARELYRSGAIGTLNMVDAYWDRNSALGAWQYAIAPDASPDTIDWDRFIGSAPKRPFDPTRLFRWRNYQDYGTGVAGDLFVHLFSNVHFVVGSLGPTRVAAMGGLRYWKDGRDVPDVMLALLDYIAAQNHPGFTLAARVNFKSGGGEGYRIRFVGSEGEITILDGRSMALRTMPNPPEPGYSVSTFSKAMQQEFIKQYRKQYPPHEPTADSGLAREEVFSTPKDYSMQQHHHQNFLAALRERKQPVGDAAYGFRAAGPALLCNMSYFAQKSFGWDPTRMTRTA